MTVHGADSLPLSSYRLLALAIAKTYETVKVEFGVVSQGGGALGVDAQSLILPLDLEPIHRGDGLGHGRDREAVLVFQPGPPHSLFPGLRIRDSDLRVEGAVAFPQSTDAALALIEYLLVLSALVLTLCYGRFGLVAFVRFGLHVVCTSTTSICRQYSYAKYLQFSELPE